MYVPQEGVVYTDDVTRLCVSHIEGDAGEKEKEKKVVAEDGNAPEFFDPLLHPPTAEDTSDWSTALLILIPLRLGLDQVNERYVPALEKTFAFPQSVGIIEARRVTRCISSARSRISCIFWTRPTCTLHRNSTWRSLQPHTYVQCTRLARS